MAINYNKEKYALRGRGSGPRDLQLKRLLEIRAAEASPPREDSALLSTLQAQVAILTEQINSRPLTTYKNEDIDEEVRKAVEETKQTLEDRFKVKELEYKEKIETLKYKLVSQEEVIKNKDMVIAALSNSTEAKTINPRPKMEQVFIDPAEKRDSVEAHIKVEDTASSTKKEEMQASVNKLKNLMGGLPRKN